jgi:hypothetical protein
VFCSARESRTRVSGGRDGRRADDRRAEAMAIVRLARSAEGARGAVAVGVAATFLLDRTIVENHARYKP